jgi:selenocysteine lyase/cysteine desulfurase
MQRTFDVQAVRELFPALGRTHNGRGVVYFVRETQGLACGT